MTVALFVTILTVGAIINTLLTEAIKRAYENAGRAYSPNVVALIDAAVIGGLGTAAVYMLMDLPWSVNNIICLVIMVVAVWVASMIGYDKVLQAARQIEAAAAAKQGEAETDKESEG